MANPWVGGLLRTETIGALTWTYDGPSDLATENVALDSVATYIEGRGELKSTTEQLLGTPRDADGERWLITDVNEDLLPEEPGRTSIVVDENADDYIPSGTEVEVHFTSWSGTDCDGGATDIHLWNGEDRNPIGTPNNREKAAVRVQSPLGECTGTILRANWILTAAHCVTTEENNPRQKFQSQNITICRLDTQDCHEAFHVQQDDAAGVFPSAAWMSGSNDPEDDWAVIKTNSNFLSGFTDMDLSNDGDNALGNIPVVHNLGLPEFGADCDENTFVRNSQDELGSIGNNKINLKIDGGDGHSGGPVYFCPEGNNNDLCDQSSEEGHVFVVWSAWITWPVTTFVGPKVPAFFSTAVAIMDNN